MVKHFKTILIAGISVIIGLVSCTAEADFNDRLTNLEDRVSKLEKLCAEMNTNISSLQGIVSALQNQDYITAVNELISDGQVIGYTINFAKGQPITIYHGADGKDDQDGADGHTPVIGVKQDTDGLWYWTIDGEWLLDSNNRKVRAVGLDGQPGQDGITPQFKIEGGYWYVSTDNGQNWTQLGKATGENGVDGDSMFQSVTVTETEVTFVTSDGQTFVVKRAAALSIEFDSADLVVMGTNATRNIHYTITSGVDNITIEALSSADIKVKVVKTDAKTGTLQVKTGATIDEYSKVVVLVNNGSQAIMRTLNFEEEAIEVEENTTKEVTDEGGEVTLEFFSNTPCHAVIPAEAQSWISLAPATKALTKQNIKLVIQPNTGVYRTADVIIRSDDSIVELVYTIEQDGELRNISVSGRIISLSHPFIPDEEVPDYSLTTGTLITLLHGGESYKYVVNQSAKTFTLSPDPKETKPLLGRDGDIVYAINSDYEPADGCVPYDNYSVFNFSQPYDLNNSSLPLQIYRGVGTIKEGVLSIDFELIYSYLRIDISHEVFESVHPNSETIRLLGEGLTLWGKGNYDIFAKVFNGSEGSSASFIYDFSMNCLSLKNQEILSFYYPVVPVSSHDCALRLVNAYGSQCAELSFDEWHSTSNSLLKLVVSAQDIVVNDGDFNNPTIIVW